MSELDKLGRKIGQITDDIEHGFEALKDDLGKYTNPLWRLIRELSLAQLIVLHRWLGELIASKQQGGQQ